MDVDKSEDLSPVKSKSKLHIWNHILEEDELSEKLAASMSKLSDQLVKRVINKKKKKKNKKNKKNKKKLQSNNVGAQSKDGEKPGQSVDQKPNVIDGSNDQLPSQGQQQPLFASETANSKNANNQVKGPQRFHHNRKKSKTQDIPYPVLMEEAKRISNRLKEKRVDLIKRTIKFLGLDEAIKLCSEVLTIEEAGGLMTMNNTRKRSPGGIFFHLIKNSGRYEANTVSKIFREGDKKEPVFKSRKKTPNNVNKVAPSNNNGVPVASNLPASTNIVTDKSINNIDMDVTTPVQSNPSDSINNETKMNDDFEESQLVIVEYNANSDNDGETDKACEKTIKCTFPSNSNHSDFTNQLLIQQPSVMFGV